MERIYKLRPLPTSNAAYGGTLIQRKYGIGTELPNVAEMYNVIAIPGRHDNIVEGPEIPLSEFYHKHRDFFGECKTADFPVRSMMCNYTGMGSVHLHPTDEYGLAHDGIRGKIEAVVRRGSGKRRCYIGHRARTKEEFVRMCEEGRYDELFIEREIEAGDFYLYDYGQLHGGSRPTPPGEDGDLATCWCTNGDLSYRIYDHGRPADPKRPIEKGKVFDCVKVPDTNFLLRRLEAKSINGCQVKCYYSSPGRFEAYDVVVEDRGTFELNEFICFTCFDGEGEVGGVHLKGGETVMVCAGYGPVSISGPISLSVISYRD